ncbi:MAG TPA: hypothetical protein PKH24_14450 [Sedimentisphaerales bacterium]|nr:hypothetical protein [Sedimentisphaerales bacterium]HNU30031.1 hypothetical protein [Sedimentisphaerales bacterium]
MSNALRRFKRQAGKYDAVPLWVKRASSGENKLSEAIEHVAQPLLDSARDDADRRLSLMIVMACWNLSLMPENERPALIKDLLAKTVKPGQSPREVEPMFESLVSRKEALFPDDKRVILDYTFVGEADEMQFFVRYATGQPPRIPNCRG